MLAQEPCEIDFQFELVHFKPLHAVQNFNRFTGFLTSVTWDQYCKTLCLKSNNLLKVSFEPILSLHNQNDRFKSCIV